MRPALLTSLLCSTLFVADLPAQCLLDRMTPPVDSEANAAFGTRVAIGPGWVVVGTPGSNSPNPNTGHVHVYREVLPNQWELHDVLEPSTPSTNFGSQFALDGDRLAVHDKGAQLVRIYELSGQGRAVQTSELAISTTAAPRLELAGEHLVLSWPNFSALSGFVDGRLAVYRDGIDGFTLQLMLLGMAEEQLGQGMCFDGSTLAVGSPGGEASGAFPHGQVRIYAVQGSQQTLVQTLLDPLGEAGSEFGSVLAVSGPRLAVAAPAGRRVEFFERVADQWQHDGSVVLPAGFNFEFEVLDLSGATLVIGARKLGLGGGGTTLVYQRLMGEWTLRTELDPPESANLPTAVAIHEGRAIVGLGALVPETVQDAAWVWSIAGSGCPGLVADPAELSVSAGGRQDWLASFAPAQAGRIYAVLGSASGSAPGLPIGGFTVPLVVDAWTLFTLQSPNVAPLDKSLGALDGIGAAAGGLVLPAGSPAVLAGLSLHHAAVVLDPLSGAVTAVSAATELALLP